MTRLGMVVLGTIAVAAAIAVAVGVGNGPSQEAKAELTPAQMAELRATPEPAKAPSPKASMQRGEDGGQPAVPDDDPEDGPGS